MRVRRIDKKKGSPWTINVALTAFHAPVLLLSGMEGPLFERVVLIYILRKGPNLGIFF